MLDEPESRTEKRSRLEDEVLEILYRSDRPPSLSDRVRSTLRQSKRSLRARPSASVRTTLARLDSGWWLASCFILGIVAYFLHSTSRFGARALVVVCLGLMVAAIVRSFRRPDRGSAKRWRGRDINVSPPARPLWLDRVMRSQRRPPRR